MTKTISVILAISIMLGLSACGSVEPADKYCSACGHGLSKEAAFCDACGKGVDSKESAASAEFQTSTTTTTTTMKKETANVETSTNTTLKTTSESKTSMTKKTTRTTKYTTAGATYSLPQETGMTTVKTITMRQTSAHRHSYSNATCTEPAKCSCGATNGSALGHSYGNADCTNPKKCSRCGRTSGNALGHSFSKGTCSRCGANDSNYIKTYSAGEYWIVDGQWKLKIDTVKTHYLCNSYANQTDGYTNEQVIVIKYTYEHIGYNGSNQLGLIFSSSHFDVYDEEGYAGRLYPCTHDNGPKYCSFSGAKSQGEETYYLTNNSTKITLVVGQFSGNKVMEKAKFVIPVS